MEAKKESKVTIKELPSSSTKHPAAESKANPLAKIMQNSLFTKIRANKPLYIGIQMLIVFAILFGAYTLIDMQSKIAIDKATISAPLISLSSDAPGILYKVYVDEGQYVSKGQRIALVGTREITAQTSGVIVNINNVPGQYVTPQTVIAKMVSPSDMRVIGKIEEDKGLVDIHAGQRVMFTADAFGSKQYVGVVDSVALTSSQSDIVFSISDKRQEQEFEIKVSFDTGAYPELRNGMSARMWVYK